MATNYNAPGPWNNFNPVGKYTASSSAMPSVNDRAAYEKKMADVYSNVKVGTDLFGNSIKGYTGTSNNSTGVNQSRAGINAQPTPGGGGSMSISLGGGNRGSSTPAGPNVSLTPQTFAPYESTYTPPTPATPVPYDYATAPAYVYGDGLSNAGAAYDIWGSKPGENPYLLSTPADYTPGIIGLDPVTLPNNMPNKGADISAFTPAPVPRTPEQIVRDYGYTGRTAPNQTNVPPSMRDSAPNAQIMLDAAAANVRNGIYPNMQAAMDAQQAFNLKYPTLTPAENAAQIAKSQEMMNKRFTKPVEAKPITPRTSIKPVTGTGASGPPGRNYATSAKKASAAKAITSYSSKKAGTISRPTFTPNYDPTKGKIRL
jgi:hypothetical protein